MVRSFTTSLLKPFPNLNTLIKLKKTLSSPLSSLCPHHLFDEMPQRTPSISHSINLFKQNPTDPSLIASTHSLAIKTNSLIDISLRTSLLTAYARAHDLESSLALFDEVLPGSRDLICWNAAITACVVNSCLETAIPLFQEMVADFGEFDSATLVIVLSALSRARNFKYGLVVHGTIWKRGMEVDVYLCNALIDMYAKCGVFRSSELVFWEMEVRDVTSWNSVIRGSVCNKFPMRSAFFYREMCCSDTRPDQVSLSCVISACSCSESLSDFGVSVHAWVIKLGYEGAAHSSVDNSLISFYSALGCVEASEKLFWRIDSRNVVSWNSMIGGLIENGRADEGVNLFRTMQLGCQVQPDAVTLLTILTVCSEFNLLRQGKSIHGFAIKKEVWFSNLSFVNCLLDMYLNCDDLTSAELLFRGMPSKDLVTWNTMIFEYSHIDSCRIKAQALFCELLHQAQGCSLATLLAILSSCNCPQYIGFGKSVHCWGLKFGFGNVTSAANALMLMYINCGDLVASSTLLETILPDSDIVSWNTVIVGYVKNGRYMDALLACEFMRRCVDLQLDPITVVSALSACGNLKLLFYGRSLHGLVLKSPIGSDLQLRNALITMYFRCGDTKSSELVFHSEGDQNLCSWSCMISGFAQNQDGRRALEYFRLMDISKLKPNEISTVGLLCSCTNLGNLRLGREVHGYIVHFEFQDNMFISSAIVDMYSKCGRLDTAVRAFENSKKKSIASWNSMISAYGFHGHGRKAVELFSEMVDLGVTATKSTFIALLSACSHNGLVDEGWQLYKLMSEEYGFEGAVEHHLLLVDMLGRAGRLHEAYKFVKGMGSKAESEVWGALLSACKDHGDLELGYSIAERLFYLNPENTGYYVTLSNLYAYNEMWSSAEDTRSKIHVRRLTKPPGSSSIDGPSRDRIGRQQTIIILTLQISRF